MRDKQDILEAVHQEVLQAPQWDRVTLIHSFAMLEVLIDIRDQFSALTTILGSVEKIAYKTY